MGIKSRREGRPDCYMATRYMARISSGLDHRFGGIYDGLSSLISPGETCGGYVGHADLHGVNVKVRASQRKRELRRMRPT